MQVYTVEELQTMISVAYAQRKQAYKLRCPKAITTSINNQIWELKEALTKAGA